MTPCRSIFIVPWVNSLNQFFNNFVNFGFISPSINNFSSSGFLLENIILSFGNKFELIFSSFWIIDSYKEILLYSSSIFISDFSFSFEFFFKNFENFFENENSTLSVGIPYKFETIIFILLKFVFPRRVIFSLSSFDFKLLLDDISIGKLIKQFLIRDKWDFGVNKIFFSDSIIINFIKVIYFSINLLSLFSSFFSWFIKELHFSNNLSKLSFLYIWYNILIPKDKIFSSEIWKTIFHNLSMPINSSIFFISLIFCSLSLSWFSSKIIFSLFISKNKAMNNFNCSKVISFLLFSEINSNTSCLIFSLCSFDTLAIFVLSDIYFLIKS